MPKATFYIDGHNSIVDAQAKWTNDSNAFNGDTVTYAESTTNGSNSSNALVGNGTNSGTTNLGDILDVSARVYAQARASGAQVVTSLTSSGESVSSNTFYLYGNTPAWTYSYYLKPPTGGWTWQKLSDLTSTTYISGSGTTNTGKLYAVEITVIYKDSVNPSRYWVGTSGNWSDTSKWSLTSGGATGASYPNGEDVYISGTSGTITVDVPVTIGKLTATATSSRYIATDSSFNITGDTSLNNVSIDYDGQFVGYGNINLTMSGSSNMATLQIGRGTPTLNLQSNVSAAWFGGGSNDGTPTINTNNYNVNAQFPDMYNINLNLGSSTLTVGSWGYDGGTLDSGTSTIIMNQSHSEGNGTGAMGGTGYYNHIKLVKSGGGTDNPVIGLGSYDYSNMSIGTLEIVGTAGFMLGTTTTVNTLIADNATLVGYWEDIGWGDSATQFTISKPSGTVEVYSANIKDSIATGGATFNAYGSTNSGNNTGWNFVNGPPTVALNSPANNGKATNLRPRLEFTGTDVDSDAITYQIQVDLNDTFDSQGTTAVINEQLEINSGSYADSGNKMGQAFTMPSTAVLKNASFFTFRYSYESAPTGTIRAEVYNVTGTPSQYPAAGATPTGSPIAVSDTVNAATIPAGTFSVPTEVVFNFSGSNRITLESGTSYAFVVSYAGITSGTLTFYSKNSSSPRTNENFVFYDGGVWSPYLPMSSDDAAFIIRSITPVPVINAVSASDSGFVDITDGADTDPFDSGDKIGYTAYAPATSSYYFDGHTDLYVSGDGTGVTNLPLAVDGNIATYAAFSPEGNNAYIHGTTAPSSGGVIQQVRVRAHNGYTWFDYYTLTTPSEGWSWEYLKERLAANVTPTEGFGTTVEIFDWDDYTPVDTFYLPSSYNLSRLEISVTTIEPYKLLNKSKYYWRVRGKDPSGSNTWGAWSTVRDFTVRAGTGDFLTFFYP